MQNVVNQPNNAKAQHWKTDLHIYMYILFMTD